MAKSGRPSAFLLALALSACASSGAPSTPTPAVDETDTPAAPATADAAVSGATVASSGSATFSDAQADRGRSVFRTECTACHFSDEFSDPQFQFKWSRRSAGDLYEVIRTTMPETEPGSLSPEQTVDIVSYIMRMNGFEPGSGELSPDRGVLDAISFATIGNQWQ